MDASPGPPATTNGRELRKDFAAAGSDPEPAPRDPVTQGSRRRRGTSARLRRAAASLPAVADPYASATARSGCGSPETGQVFYPAQDWNGIEIGSTVDVHLPGGYSYPGSVDDKTADSGVIWIRSDGGTRRMFGHLEGVRLAPRTSLP
ncbi:hypothetical protein JHV56_08625 [Arthrobacter sp. BHU FT2]|nr:hypothetical protein [Arthrobacter sp. BHU FT2]